MTKTLCKESLQKLDSFMEENLDKEGILVPILHESQKLFGFIPFELQKRIADKTNIPLAEIYGVVTFYSHFSIEPKGDYVVGICMGTACYVKNAGKIVEDFEKELGIAAGETTEDGKFSIEATRCIGACGLAPVLTVNQDVYGRLKAKHEEVVDILAKY